MQEILKIDFSFIKSAATKAKKNEQSLDNTHY